MNWGAMASVTVIVILIFLYEWPKFNRNQQKEKAAFVALTAIGCLLAILLIVYPNLPGPTQLVEIIYRPLSNLLEH